MFFSGMGLRVSLCQTSLHHYTLQQQPGRAQTLALEVWIQKAPGRGWRKSLQIDRLLQKPENRCDIEWGLIIISFRKQLQILWSPNWLKTGNNHRKCHVSGDMLLVSPVPSKVWLRREHCQWLSNVSLLENSLWFGTNHPFFSWSTDQSNLQWIHILKK